MVVAGHWAVANHVAEFQAVEALLVAGDFAAIPRQMPRTSAVVAFTQSIHISGVVVAVVVAAIRRAWGRPTSTAPMEERLTNERRDGLKDGIGVIREILLSHFYGSGNALGGRLHFGPSMRVGDERGHLGIEVVNLRSAGMPRDRMRHFLRKNKICRWFWGRDGRRKISVSVKNRLKNHGILLGVVMLRDDRRFFEKI